MRTVYLIRHAESEHDLHGVIGGNSILSARGLYQALYTRNFYSSLNPAAVFTGKQSRMAATGVALFGEAGEDNKQRKKLSVFNEFRFGELEENYMSNRLVRSLFQGNTVDVLKAYEGDDPHKRAKRAIKKIEKIAGEYETAAIITSDFMIRSILLEKACNGEWNEIKTLPVIANLKGIKIMLEPGSAEEWGTSLINPPEREPVRKKKEGK